MAANNTSGATNTQASVIDGAATIFSIPVTGNVSNSLNLAYFQQITELQRKLKNQQIVLPPQVCPHKNPLLRDGTNQAQRFPLSLASDYIKIDERDLPDLIAFSEKFSKLLNFWDANNQLAGDWRAFFEKDISITISSIIKTDLKKYKSDFYYTIDEINKQIKKYSNITTLTEKPEIDSEINKLFIKLFEYFYKNTDSFVAIFRLIEDWNNRLIADNGMKQEVNRAIRVELNGLLNELYIYQKDVWESRKTNSVDTDAILPDFDTIVKEDYAGFSSEWGLLDLTNFVQPIIYKSSIAGCVDQFTTEQQEALKLENAVQNISKLFEIVYGTAQVLINKAPKYLQESLESYALHESHLSLYITFIQLFRYVQNDINQITERHLDFYYREVLTINEKEAVPDSVSILFELSKNVIDQKVDEGTLLNAGKDATGNPRHYKTDTEIIVNQAKIKSIKSVFIEKAEDTDTSYLLAQEPIVKSMYIAPVSNSKDGNGVTAAGDNGWSFFGENQTDLAINDRTMLDANIGYAIASPQLLLKEGNRTITLELLFNDTADIFAGNLLRFVQAELKYNLVVDFSTPEGWVNKNIKTVKVEKSISVTGIQGKLNKVTIVIELDSGFPSVTKYDTEVLGTDYKTLWPMLRIYFDPNGLDIAQLFGNGGIRNIPYSLQLFGGSLGVININGVAIETKEDILNKIPVYDENTSYYHRDVVVYNGLIFKKNNKLPKPNIDTDFWQKLDFDATIVPDATIISFPSNIYPSGSVVLFKLSPTDIGEYYISKTTILPENLTYWDEVKIKSFPYKYFQKQQLHSITIDTNVQEVNDLVIQNDITTLSTAKAFQPFGPKPSPGSNFYIGSNEVFQKKLTNLRLKIEWEGLPDESLVNYYKEYAYLYDFVGDKTVLKTGSPTSPNITNFSFSAEIALLVNKIWRSSSNNSLFFPQSGKPSDFRTINLDNQYTTYERDVNLKPTTQFDVSTQRGFLRLKLTSTTGMPVDFAFGHQQFPNLLTNAVLTQNGTLIPNQPYTPSIKSISIDYSSRHTINFTNNSAAAYEKRVDQLFHIHPFGTEEVHPYLLQKNESVTGIRIAPVYTQEGYLYLGLEKLKAPAIVSMLFQQIEGSSDPDLETQPIEWSYMRDNRWVNLESINILTDTTNGLLDTGIIRFNIPQDITNNNTILPPGLHWLRASIAKNTTTINKAVDIKTQAVSATYVVNEGAAEHLKTALPALTVKKLLEPKIGVKSISQPFSSYGGKIKETGQEYYTRVSERLRHKNRSVTIWDFERMVLEEFPSVYKVKCLNHTSIGKYNNLNELHAGNVLVITIPNLRNKNAVNPLEPKVNLATLEKIKNYLNNYISPFVNLQVKNPQYEKIKVNCKVGYHIGYDPGFYTEVLQEDLRKFLAPWAYDEGRDIVFGGGIHGSQILNFIEEREYVDFVIDFSIDHIVSEKYNIIYLNQKEAIATTSRSILVSAKTHNIQPLQPGVYPCEGEQFYSGINFWVIETDFKVQ